MANPVARQVRLRFHGSYIADLTLPLVFSRRFTAWFPISADIAAARIMKFRTAHRLRSPYRQIHFPQVAHDLLFFPHRSPFMKAFSCA